MNNYVINALGYNKRARIFYSETTDLIRQAQGNLQLNQTLEPVYLEFITAMSILSGSLVDNEKLFIKFTGDCSNRQMTGLIDASGNIRGLIKEGFTPAQTKAVFGNRGFITVNRDNGRFSGYTGIVEMSYASVAKNLENYFRKSEQLPTYMRLFLNFDNNRNAVLARGVMLQLLPGETKSIISDFNSVITKNISLFHNPYIRIDVDMWDKLLNSDFDYMSQKPVQYKCDCVKEQYYGIIFSLSPAEIDEIIKNKQTLEAACSSCGKKYCFPYNEIAELFGISVAK
ncbi:33 kDa chaperonin [bioreactor metagenome]|uniref:33 kDa chaperonin n=1 Tax=bioreactor metagenome TaxID=1076179 RepID=A0A645CAE4_9ZZZZ|nr:Hsp33 family molecular chaperone HslO [Lutispora sp.]MEA4961630.1 Hsp33 family molecular chaperone HslO [Lutispora sp.]HCJ56502.1 hypothetical protein [Clostridiaceae bacterium]